MITNVEYSVKNQFNFTFDCEKTCIIYCLRINEFNIASCPKSSYLHEDFQNFRSLRYTNDERYFTIKKNSRQIQYDYVIYSNVITLREHLDSHPRILVGSVLLTLFVFCGFFDFVCLHPVSCVSGVTIGLSFLIAPFGFLWRLFDVSMNDLSVADLCVTKDCITAGKYYM